MGKIMRMSVGDELAGFFDKSDGLIVMLESLFDWSWRKFASNSDKQY
jgi:hypothetical protein